jgi:hypothetical protein
MAEPNDNRFTESLLNVPSVPAPAKQSVRSFKYETSQSAHQTMLTLSLVLSRKKYAKLKVRFELASRENESLIREELRIEDLSKRIQEQNEYEIYKSSPPPV